MHTNNIQLEKIAQIRIKFNFYKVTRKGHLGDIHILYSFMVNTHPPTHQHQERSWSKKQGVQNNILFL